MSEHRGQGTSPFPPASLEAAIAAAWEDAQKDAALKKEKAGGRYRVEISIVADNPIRSYHVTIIPE